MFVTDYSRIQAFFAALENDLNVVTAAKNLITWERLPAYLPFNTRLVAGENHNHLRMDSVYPVTTHGAQRRVVTEGMTLCRKAGPVRSAAGSRLPHCEGCLQVGRSLALTALK